MITSLRAGEIDIGIGLTEGWVAGLGKDDLEGDGGYKIVGTYVETPLCMSLLSVNRHIWEQLRVEADICMNRLGNFHWF